MRSIALALCVLLSLAGPALAEGAPTPPGPSTPSGPPAPSGAQALDQLYDRLAKARTDEEAKGISSAIQRAQIRSGSDTADLLMARAMTAFQGGNDDLAIQLLSATIRLEPGFTEAWNRRATAYYRKNDYARSMVDIAETLKRDPRHYGAWAGLGMILRETGDKARAYAAFQKALAINPHLPDVRKAVDDLRPEVEGRDI